MAAPRREETETSLSPELLGPYWLLETIGWGRTGSVHRACLRREGKPDKLLALKRIAPDLGTDPRFAQRFLEVMARAAQVVHPALCTIEDVDRTEDGVLYAGLELIAGKNLGQIAAALGVRGDAMPPALLAYVGNQVADALAAAHRAHSAGQPSPVFHGELGPDHILIGYDGSVRLIGLGTHALSSVLPQASPRAPYRAPELAQGGACSAQADVFSLGACMYELLTGSPAVAGHTRDERFEAHRNDSQITKVIPRALEPIVSRALADRPEERFESATELGRALRRWLSLQSAPRDAAALAAFMRDLFASSCEGEAARELQALARIPTDVRGAMPLKPASFAPDPLDAAAEQTPARGILMNELAAKMAEPGRPSSGIRASMPVPKGQRAQDWDDQTPAQVSISVTEPDPEPVATVQDAKSGSAPAFRGGASVGPTAPALRGGVLAASTAPALRGGALVGPTAPALRGGASVHTVRPAPPPEPAPRPARWRSWVAVAAIAIGAGLAVIALRPSAGDPTKATLQVQTRPSGAEVFVRGELMGTTPLDPVQLQAGSAELELRMPGFEPVARPVTLSAGQLLDLQVDLVPRAPQGAPAPPAEAGAPAIATAPTTAAPTARQRAWAPARPSTQRSGAPAALKASGAPITPPDEDDGFGLGGALFGSAPDSEDEAESSAELSAAAPAEAAAALAAGESSGANVIARIVPSPTAEPPAAAPKAAPAAVAKTAKPAAGPSRPAVLVNRVEPRFPARAHRSGISEGNVTVELTIDPSGAVSSARVVAAQPAGMFEDAAVRAAEQWRFQPQLVAGKPVSSRQRVKFRFAE